MNINSLKEIEDHFLSLFCQKKQLSIGIKYFDEDHKTKYWHNCILLNPKYSFNQLKQYYEENINRGFVLFLSYETNDESSFSFAKYSIDNTIFLVADIENLQISVKNECKIEKVTSENILAMKEYNFEANLEYGEEYARENSNRIVDACIKLDCLDIYIIYMGNSIIGSILTYIDGEVAKLENFTIREEYQRKGYGSALMKFVLDALKQKEVKTVYLAADNDDTPKLMYMKWGFKPLGSLKAFLYKKDENEVL